MVSSHPDKPTRKVLGSGVGGEGDSTGDVLFLSPHTGAPDPNE